MFILGWSIAFAFIGVAGVLRAGGSSLMYTPRADALRAANEGARGADTVAQLLQDRSKIQPALSTTVTAVIVFAVIPMTWALTDTFAGFRLAFALIFMTFGILLAADVIPRRIGRKRPGSLAYRLAPVLAFAVSIGAAAGDLIADPDEDVAANDLDPLGVEERELMHSVVEFTNTIVREVMVPRTDMITINGDASTDDAVDIVLSSGRSRIPVMGEGVDHVIGIVYARDLLELFDQEEPARTALSLSHDAFFVPETKPITKLLREMQASQQHLAIVIDEFGGTAGLVTIEDLIEELVGEIADEYDEEDPMIVEVDGAWIVDARLDVDDLAVAVGVDLPSDEWDTVGGLVLELAGRVPEVGEAFDHVGLVFTADSVQGRRVAKVRVTRS